MAISVSRGFQLVSMVAAGTAVVAAAGCASTSGTAGAASSAASAGSSSAAAGASSASSAATASSAAATSPAATTSPSGAASASGGSTGLAACTTQDLQVTTGPSEGATGSTYLSIRFTNTSSTACTLYGYPGVSLVGGASNAQVGAAASRQSTPSASVVALQPGQTGSALLRVVQALNYPQATCSPTATSYLRVYPPSETVSVLLPFKSTGCTATSVNLLTIEVVQTGAGQQ